MPVTMPDDWEGRAISDAMFQRMYILKEYGEKAKAEGKDLGVSHSRWDGESLHFQTVPLADGEPTPKGWHRYSKDYWKWIK